MLDKRLIIVIWLISNSSIASDTLTLSQALSLLTDEQPEIAIPLLQQQYQQVEKQRIAQQYYPKVLLEGALAWVKPAEDGLDQSYDNHYLGVVVSQKLYDFGYQQAQQLQADEALAVYQYIYQDKKITQYLAILERFFDVLLADLYYEHLDEAMAMEYVRLDRKRQRYQLKKVDELAVLEQEVTYQKLLTQRVNAAHQQRLTRHLLADVLNISGQLPSKVAIPQIILPPLEQTFDTIQQQVLNNNLQLKKIQQQIKQQQAQIQIVRKQYHPVVNLQLKTDKYSRNSRYQYPWAAELQLSIPLYQRGDKKLQVQQQQIVLQELQQQKTLLQRTLLQEVLAIWLELQSLKTKIKENTVATEWAELALEKNRIQYEMEMQSDLGDAMVELSKAQWLMAKARFRRIYLRARLDALQGKCLLLEDEKEE